MKHSVRLRQVGRLRRHIDQFRKRIAKTLGGYDAHAVAADCHDALLGQPYFSNDCSEANAHIALCNAAFDQNVVEYQGRSLSVDQLNQLAGNTYHPSGFDNDVLGHQRALLNNIYDVSGQLEPGWKPTSTKSRA